MAHDVREGVVYCAEQRREIDVLTCYACPKLVRIDLDSRRPIVVCRIAQPEAGSTDASPPAHSASR